MLAMPEYEDVLTKEVDALIHRLCQSGWDPLEAMRDARAACGAAWDMDQGRYVWVGYANAPRERI